MATVRSRETDIAPAQCCCRALSGAAHPHQTPKLQVFTAGSSLCTPSAAGGSEPTFPVVSETTQDDEVWSSVSIWKAEPGGRGSCARARRLTRSRRRRDRERELGPRRGGRGLTRLESWLGLAGCGLDGTQGLQGLPLTPPPPPGGPAHCPGLGPWLTLRARPGVERLGYENY